MKQQQRRDAPVKGEMIINSGNPDFRAEAGFSLLELVLAMTVTLVVMGMASALLAGSFNIRSRENQKSEAIADVQRALNIMTREIANSGFGLTNNGIVAADSGLSQIRFRANLNAYRGQTTSDSVTDRDEDIEYRLVSDGSTVYIMRLDINTNNTTTVLANRIDTFRIRYYASKIDYTVGDCDIVAPAGVTEVAQKSSAGYIVITVCVTLPARGSPKSPGYQPAAKMQLVSDINLRNANLTQY
ncbi:MAG TPA: prepilin-type N-terminal cleavage/methylation domain-containing protein [Pyrinomonadaceae bacterium]|jgi:type II secretory pathway pseudopilin PulG|nr:prepilin-type N-terminal cleavage/methylation domain-containing protein [Pyrinomonadaceae bacterium]